MVWFTSDTHAYHKNICKGSTEWDREANSSNGMTCRDFKDQYEMTENLIETFNKHLKQDDVLYHLGDWSFGGVDKIGKFRERLVVGTIHLCHGNHDHNIISSRSTQFQGKDTPSKELFNSTQDVLWQTIRGVEMFLSHYAHRVWPGSHKGVIHLYGHSHDSIPDHGKSMDVGVDVAYRMFGEYRPFSFEEIVSIMKGKQIAFEDHHGPNTNSR